MFFKQDTMLKRFWFVTVQKRKFCSVHAGKVVESISQIDEGEKSRWESVVGLEIHAQINAKAKLFSNSSTSYGAPTNTQVSYFDAAIPGTMPVLNKRCVEAGILTALALNCTVNKMSMFDRKHYFYPDLPAGYQITQQFYPLAMNGRIDFVVHNRFQKLKPYNCSSKLKQLQLEQDSGKSFHMKEGKSLVDLNRAGIGLMELVFEPDLKNGMEAAMLVRELILILTRLDTCTCEMDEGALRIDANISVNKQGEPFGVRTEVKNINSAKYVANAIDFEIQRQIEILENNGYVANETRAYDFKSKKTIFMRDKEELQDYRFMPEPNLPPIQLCDDSDEASLKEADFVVNIDTLRRNLPVLPAEDRAYLMTTYNLCFESADRIVKEKGLKEMFEIVTSSQCDAEYVCEFLINNVQHQLNLRKLSIKTCPVTGKQIEEIVRLICTRVMSEATANDVLEMLFNGDLRSAEKIVEEYNWYLISEGEELEKLCMDTMTERPKMVKKYKTSKKNRYMMALLKGLNEKVNNRASMKDAEETFIRLMAQKEVKC